MENNTSLIAINDADFEQKVLKAGHPVLVDFVAGWCGSCQTMLPILDEIGKTLSGKLSIVKLDVDNNPIVPTTYGVRNLPTMLLFKNGEIVDKVIGATPRHQIEARLQQHI